MTIFDTLIVQPIFNLLLTIYGIVPFNDFGIALIIFTIIVRLVMWPLIKKQLHQTKLMRKVQPELKRIKQKTKGNRALEAQMMMELYKERGIKPFSSIGLLLVQLPIFIALFRVIQIITAERDQIGKYAYDFIEQLGPIANIIAHPDRFNEMLFGVVDLTRQAVQTNTIYIPLIILAVVAAVLQYIQSKQLLPENTSKKKLKDILKDSAAGKEVDQAEVTAIMS
ncbi:MAG TPA: YidC/Oxa1 family membrane protein insertase, partial [Candidatus Saccharimonadales bacterium]